MREWTKGALIFLYETAPTSKVVGYAVASEKLKIAKWKLIHRHDLLSEIGVTSAEVDNYLHGRETAYLYRLTDPVRFDTPVEIKRGLQSYKYVSDVDSYMLMFRGLDPVPADYLSDRSKTEGII